MSTIPNSASRLFGCARTCRCPSATSCATTAAGSCGSPTTGWPGSSTSSNCSTTTAPPTSSATPTTPGEPRERSARSPSCGRRATGRRRGSSSPGSTGTVEQVEHPRARPPPRDRRLVARRRRAADAGRPRRPRVRRARRADAIRGGDDRARHAAAISRGAAAPRQTATSGTRRRPCTAGRCPRGSWPRCAMRSGWPACPVGMGASLGGLAMLQAQRTWPGTLRGAVPAVRAASSSRAMTATSRAFRATGGSRGTSAASCARRPAPRPSRW